MPPEEEKWDEKHEEKWDEKHEEKWGKHGDPFWGVGWGIFFIFVGMLIWIHRTYPDLVTGGNWWAWMFLGVGVISLCLSGVRWFIPEHRRPLGGPVFLALIFIFIGLHGLDLLVTWFLPVILIILGVCIIGYALTRRSHQ